MKQEIIPTCSLSLDERSRVPEDARTLHEFLGVKKKFNDWIKYQIEKYGFVEGEDYLEVIAPQKRVSGSEKTDLLTQKRVSGKTDAIEYHLTAGMAKELGMVSRTEKGKEIRRYFIAVEKRAIEDSIAHAVQAALQQERDEEIAAQCYDLFVSQQSERDFVTVEGYLRRLHYRQNPNSQFGLWDDVRLKHDTYLFGQTRDNEGVAKVNKVFKTLEIWDKFDPKAVYEWPSADIRNYLSGI